MGIYSIKSGETVSSIARANNTSVQQIAKANPNLDINRIKAGQKINLPDAKTDTFQKTANTTVRPNFHTVQKGDSLEKISQKYFIPLDDLKTANKNINPAKMQVGQKVNIPEKKSVIKQVDERDKNFKAILPKILKDEGGFKPAEKDGSDVKTNKGITQDTYNRYLKDKAFDKSQKTADIKDVKNITEKEVKEIYYNYYYKKSGADKEKDKKTAYWMTDTAVNCGVSKAKDLRKACGTDNEKWYNSRKNTYNSIANNNSAKKKFLSGWLNRIQRIKTDSSV